MLFLTLVFWSCVTFDQGPIVQSVISLTSSLRVISLTVLADLIHNILKIFCWKNVSSFCTAKATHIFFSKKFQHICVYIDVNFKESLTNNVVSFEQLGPVVFLLTIPKWLLCGNSSLFVRRWFQMWCLFVIVCFSSLLILVPQEGCVSWLWSFLGICPYSFVAGTKAYFVWKSWIPCFRCQKANIVKGLDC